MHQKKTQYAFTFIELFLVIIIILVLAGVSIPNLRKFFNYRQLESLSSDLQSFMNYLSQRAIVEGRVIYLNIKEKEYSGRIQGAEKPFRTYPIPEDIKIKIIKKETDKAQIFFNPDGQIEKVTIKLTNPDNQEISLTTEGVFGKVKIKTRK